jgi:hypothetical protein
MERWMRKTETIVVGIALAVILVAYVVSRFSQ